MSAPAERHVRVGRTARYYVIGDPGPGTRELWVACHGYGQLASGFARALGPLEHQRRVVIVPEALSRFYLDDPAKRHGPDSPVGASWMTREDRQSEIVDHVEYLDALTTSVRGEIPDASVTMVALGFSQGVATVSRWAALGTTAIQRLILWSGTVPPDLPRDRGDRLFGGASVVLVSGRRDALASPEAAEQAHRAMHASGLASRVVLFDGGHSLNGDTLRQLAAEISNAA